MLSRQAREALVIEHMQSENDLDFGRTMATFSHPRYEIIPTGAVYDGAAAVDEYFRTSRSAFPDQRNELIALRHADDAVVVEFWLLGTHRGRLADFEPTGREIRIRMIALYLFDDTGITCERVYFDQLGLLKQLGLLPAVS